MLLFIQLGYIGQVISNRLFITKWTSWHGIIIMVTKKIHILLVSQIVVHRWHQQLNFMFAHLLWQQLPKWLLSIPIELREHHLVSHAQCSKIWKKCNIWKLNGLLQRLELTRDFQKKTFLGQQKLNKFPLHYFSLLEHCALLYSYISR